MFLRWLKIRRVKREIANLVNARGIPVRVLKSPLMDVFYIATGTDRERDALRNDYPTLYSQLCDVLLRVGYKPSSSLPVSFPVESQETVDRDYGGSWSEAMEMP